MKYFPKAARYDSSVFFLQDGTNRKTITYAWWVFFFDMIEMMTPPIYNIQAGDGHWTWTRLKNTYPLNKKPKKSMFDYFLDFDKLFFHRQFCLWFKSNPIFNQIYAGLKYYPYLIHFPIRTIFLLIPFSFPKYFKGYSFHINRHRI